MRCVLIAAVLSLVSGQQPVYRAGLGVTPPVVINKVDPEFSQAARAARVQGTVVLETVVAEDGVPNVIRVVRGLGYGLDENAIAAVEQWRFNPGTKDGTPIKGSLNIEVNFNLDVGSLINPQTGVIIGKAPGSTGQVSNGVASATTDPEQAVQAWYRAFEGCAGTRAQYGGYVGGRFDKAYGLLAPTLKDKMTDAAFEETYAELANMKFLQAHLASMDNSAGNADVYVEEERTVVFNNIPAVAWYQGTLHVTRSAGDWQIAGIDLRPEDLISVNFGGHMPWRNNPVEVAQIAARPPDSCMKPDYKYYDLVKKYQTDIASGIADIDLCGDSRYVVRLFKLHSGEWRVLKIQSR